MKKELFFAVFEGEAQLLRAVRLLRENQFTIHDVYTPFAVHGLDEAMGEAKSRLTYVCFFFAFLGLATAVLIQFWIGSIDWPLNVGGKPFNSLPAYLPVTFELTVLFGGLGVAATLLAWLRLYPGKKSDTPPHPRVTDDRFVIALETDHPSFDADETVKLLKEAPSVEHYVIPG